MNLNVIWTEMEEEMKWRMDEIRFFSNHLANLSTTDEQDQFRRAIILLLYAHFEGFCKFAFLTYIRVVNNEGLFCKDVNYAMVASALSQIFYELRDPQKKADLFRSTLPEDAKLHRFARDKEFVERIDFFEQFPVEIPDEIIDLESNLKPSVLSKVLFYLGLDHEAFKSLEGNIHKLLNYRNNIAHGQTREGISEASYESISSATFKIMNDVRSFVMSSLTEKTFLRQVP
jgi:hypothetical protein